MADRKSNFTKRKLGNRLLTSLIKQCGEDVFEEDRTVLRLLIAICCDTNYLIRMDGAIFFREYFKENHEQLAKFPRLEQTYIPELIELCNDEEMYIRLEAIESLNFVLETLALETVEKEVIPSLLNLLGSVH
jgi:hypothetical protein